MAGVRFVLPQAPTARGFFPVHQRAWTARLERLQNPTDPTDTRANALRALQVESAPALPANRRPDTVMVMNLAFPVEGNHGWKVEPPIENERPARVKAGIPAGIGNVSAALGWEGKLAGQEVLIDCRGPIGNPSMIDRRVHITGFESGDGHQDTTGQPFAEVGLSRVHRKPASLTFEEAASFMLVSPTALKMVEEALNVRFRGSDVEFMSGPQFLNRFERDEMWTLKDLAFTRARLSDTWALVFGVTGGVGAYTALHLKHLGVRTIGVVSNRDRADFATNELGVDHVIDRSEFNLRKGREKKGDTEKGIPSFKARVRELSGGKGVQMAFDAAGQVLAGIMVVENGGIYITCGSNYRDGYVHGVNEFYLIGRTVRWQGSHYADWRQVEEAIGLHGRGEVRVVPYRTLPFAEFPASVQAMYENRQGPGKVVHAVMLPETGLKTTAELEAAWARAGYVGEDGLVVPSAEDSAALDRALAPAEVAERLLGERPANEPPDADAMTDLLERSARPAPVAPGVSDEFRESLPDPAKPGQGS